MSRKPRRRRASPGKNRPNRGRPTTKEGADGLLYLLRDDGRTKRMSRGKALAWARRNAPAAVERLEAAYAAAGEADANARVRAAERRIRGKERAAAVLRAAGWVEREDGSFALEVDGASYRTDPETAAEFADRLGPEALRRKLLELARGKREEED